MEGDVLFILVFVTVTPPEGLRSLPSGLQVSSMTAGCLIEFKYPGLKVVEANPLAVPHNLGCEVMGFISHNSEGQDLYCSTDRSSNSHVT